MNDLAETFRGKRILITGGLGFIGSNLATRLVEHGGEVLLVDSLIPEYGGNFFNIHNIRGQVRVNISDVRDEYSLKYLVQGQDYIFNLAGQTSHLDSMEHPAADLAINCGAQLAILQACLRHNSTVKVVFAGTRQIYGKPQYLPVDEKHPLDPVDINGINKMAGEFYHLVFHRAHGLRTCVLRLTNTIGPRMRVRDARQTFVGVWMRRLLEGQPIEVWGGEQLRDFTYVDDAVEALIMAACSDAVNGEVFNLGGEGAVSLRQLAEWLVELHGSGDFVVREFPENRQRIDIGDYYADFTKIHTALGWAPRISVREALRRTLDYYRAHLAEYI